MALKDQLNTVNNNSKSKALNPKELLKKKSVKYPLMFLILYIVFCLLRLLISTLYYDVLSVINLF